ERLLAAGALDVFAMPVQMKKGRPGVQLTVLCAAENADSLETMLFAEATTFGVRRSACRRRKLARESQWVPSRWGPGVSKVGRHEGKVVTASPEYEDCAKIAREHGIPLREVMADARHAWQHMAKHVSGKHPATKAHEP